MNKKNILVSIAVIAVLGGLILWGRSSVPATSNIRNASISSSFEFNTLAGEEKNYDFGSISMSRGKVSHEFKIKNSGTEPIVVTKMYTSCMCTSASFVSNAGKFGPFGMPGHGFVPRLDQTIAPKGEIVVEAVFDPGAHGPAGVGPIKRSIYLESEGRTPLELTFEAVVTP